MVNKETGGESGREKGRGRLFLSPTSFFNHLTDREPGTGYCYPYAPTEGFWIYM